jgi:N-acetylglucosamine-6-phosphate deacetylase
MIPGLHIEGPFLSDEDGYRGAHPLDAVRPADPDLMRQLLDAAGGLARIVTLAPERDAGLRVTRQLADRGIVVAAGHCNPTADQLAAALDAGLSLFTHLGNGCPMQVHRHENIIQRVLHAASRSALYVSFIADGVHVPYPALANYLKVVPGDQAIVVTDAMAAAGLGPGVHRLGRWEVEVDEHLAAWAPDRSHLVGSAIRMPEAVARLRDELGYDAAAVDRLTRANPQRLLQSKSRQETP